MRTITLLTTICFAAACLPSAMAQSVIASGGNHHDNGNMAITYTIGEPVITTVGSGASQLTQGFNQPWVDINTAVDDPGIEENTITVYPNPVRHVLNLAFSEAPEGQRYELFDDLGKRILDGRVQSTITELNMEPYASGGYFLRVFGPDNSFLRSFKITVAR